MKILLVMDPGILVPPKGYGGHERLVYMFAREYQKLGHEVHLLVTTGSQVEGCTVHHFGKERFPQNTRDFRKAIGKAWVFLWKHRNEFDLIHNFGRLLYLLPVLNHPVKKIMTYGREINARNINIFNDLPNRNIIYTGCSTNLVERAGANGNWETVYNAIDFSKYDFVPSVAEDAPLIFLGRIEKVKGCHTAIKVAKQTGNKLIIAGNISPLPEEQLYFEEQVKPYIDGEQIKYIGQVNDEQKNEFLGQAKALLFPIHWNEPFGIVMIEAMACGTPVIAFNSGSVNEVIDEGITGLKVSGEEEMIAAVKKINQIQRAGCRERACGRFNVRKIAEQYLAIFETNKKRRIVIVTTGQPAANPRIVKEYEALKEEGYDVKVLYTYSADWSYQIDKTKFSKGILDQKDFVLIGGEPHDKQFMYFFSRLYFRIFKILMRIFPLPFFKNMAIARVSLPLWRRAAQYKAGLYIAHYIGALPAAARAAKKNNAIFAFDAEDYHRGESAYYPEQRTHITEVEDKYLPLACYITAASPLIAEAYKKLYPGIPVVTVNNVFSKKFVQPAQEATNGPLQLFWFSQYIGPNRGLEIIFEALNIVKGNVALYLLGNTKNPGYLQSLLQKVNHPQSVHLLEPVDPDDIFSVVARFDIGLASEVPHCENRNICLTNKIFTYLVGGICIMASDTDAQKQLVQQHSGIGLVYKHDSPADLAAKIQQLIDNRALLQQFKNQSLALAASDYNWEKESGKLNAIVAETLRDRYKKENSTAAALN